MSIDKNSTANVPENSTSAIEPPASAGAASPEAARSSSYERSNMESAGLSDPLTALLEAGEQFTIQAVTVALNKRRRAEKAESDNFLLQTKAEGFDHFLGTEETVKWADACQILGVAPNLFGAYLRDRKVLITNEYWVTQRGKRFKRQGERHNKPYAQYAHWFDFPAYPNTGRVDSKIPHARQYDRRVTKAGRVGLLALLRRHVKECGHCGICKSVRLRKPAAYAQWRYSHRSQGGAA